MAIVGENGGGATSGIPSVNDQSSRTGATQVPSANATNTQAPPNAGAAPKPSTTTVGTGLVAALNTYQQSLKSKGLVEIADIYEIKFADSIIADATIVPPAGLNKNLVVGSTGTTASDKLLPNKQTMDPKSRARAAAAGQQIVQFIDQVIRSSKYIQDQASQTWNQSTNSWEPTKTPTAQQFAWFQVLCNVDILGYDNKRQDHAYRMTFTVVPYETPMLSAFFPSGKYRGVHKFYQYWFTGFNDAVLSFEQSFNNQWTQALTGPTVSETKVQKLNYPETWRLNVFPASGQSNQGGERNTNEPGANAADFLYSSDLATAKIQIVGDPAWIPNTNTEYVTPETFTAEPFLSDGTINTVASGAYFAICFDTPADYNLQTGLVDPRTAPNGQNDGTVTTVYVASKVTHTFKNGRFTQELEGSWVTYDASSRQPAGPAVETEAREITPKPNPTGTPGIRYPESRTTEQQRTAQTNPPASARSPLAVGTQQILNPVTQSDAPTLTQLTTSVAYVTARQQGIPATQALEIARRAFAQGTAGQPTPPQRIVKDGNPG